MENHQNIPEEQPDDSDTPPSRSRHHWGDPATSIFLGQLIHRPWLVWLGVGSFLLLTIYISLFSIFQPPTFRDEASQPTPTGPSSQTGSSLPWWLLAGATLGGVVGSVAIARKLPILPQFAQYQRFQSAATRVARRQRRQLLQHEQQVLNLPPVGLEPAAEPPLESQLLEIAPLAIEPNFSPQEPPYLKAEMAEQSLVEETMKILIVLDEQQPNLAPIEEEEKQVFHAESLAEMLDIRKKLPLSVILGDLK